VAGLTGWVDLTPTDLRLLTRCVDLAQAAVEVGDEPFGSLLVDAAGTVLVQDHNRVAAGDRTAHPELAIARWAAAHLTPADRATATVYTSGEHCPMCAAAHGWVGLGRIVCAATTAQLEVWREQAGLPPGPVAPLPVSMVLPGAVVHGPAVQLEDRVHALHRRHWAARG
jgi:tRNA(Arg) A34 adenosine deaminase TadA